MRMHWTQRRRTKEQITLAVLASLPSRRRVAGPVRLRYTLRYARARRDLDNLGASLKYPLDALVSAGVLEDDSPEHVAELVLRQEKVARVADQGFTIELEPLTP